MVGIQGTIFASPEFATAIEQAGIEIAIDDFVMRRGVE